MTRTADAAHPTPADLAGGTVPEPTTPTAEDEVAAICRDLIRIDSSNYGDGSGPGERAAAEHVAGLLSEVGLEPEVFESAERRTSLVVRWEGEDSSRPGLLIHGHLDVVPAEARDWTHDPFAGEIVDGCVWGRGAVDMKNMDAMVLAVVLVARHGAAARKMAIPFGPFLAFGAIVALFAGQAILDWYLGIF